MLKFNIFSYVALAVLFNVSGAACKKADDPIIDADKNTRTVLIEETFEKGTKAAYSEATINLNSGSWIFNDALIGNLTGDNKNGANAARIRNNGYLYTNFTTASTVKTVSINYAKYTNDADSKFQIQYSLTTDTTWIALSDTISVNNNTLNKLSLAVNITGQVRFKILKVDGNSTRINIDDFVVVGAKLGSQNQSNDNTVNHILLGNPSNATYDIVNAENYLLEQPYFISSYSSSKGIPNWVSWHIEEADFGAAKRQDDFRANTTLPNGWFAVQSSSYSGSGFDRGHMCPSADRTSTVEANSATFLMTNMIPQAPRNNQGAWAQLEEYTRTQVKAGNEAYVISGTYGSGGVGSQGTVTYTLASGKINVPTHVWKIIVILPNGTNDLTRIKSETRIIAVVMPNINSIGSNWRDYRTNVKAIEASTGYNFLSNLSSDIKNSLAQKVDNL